MSAHRPYGEIEMRQMSTYKRKEKEDQVDEKYVVFSKEKNAWFFLDDKLIPRGPYTSEEEATSAFGRYCKTNS
jgi:hypothetical protein